MDFYRPNSAKSSKEFTGKQVHVDQNLTFQKQL